MNKKENGNGKKPISKKGRWGVLKVKSRKIVGFAITWT